jgi:hypothetical protein
MSTTPLGRAGDAATHEVEVEEVTAVPAVVPKFTVVEPITKPVPVMATEVPPDAGQALRLTAVTAVTVGTGELGNWLRLGQPGEGSSL